MLTIAHDVILSYLPELNPAYRHLVSLSLIKCVNIVKYLVHLPNMLASCLLYGIQSQRSLDSLANLTKERK